MVWVKIFIFLFHLDFRFCLVRLLTFCVKPTRPGKFGRNLWLCLWHLREIFFDSRTNQITLVHKVVSSPLFGGSESRGMVDISKLFGRFLFLNAFPWKIITYFNYSHIMLTWLPIHFAPYWIVCISHVLVARIQSVHLACALEAWAPHTHTHDAGLTPILHKDSHS